ncbi:MAG TPA: hypothetical protein VK576_07230 [Thermoleophilia bacterium]|nr:hypothetical protein [Thermoleophilia bacterium]
MDDDLNDLNEVCELCRHPDGELLATVARFLEARGIEADVWPERFWRAVPWASPSSRLMVRCRDLVYARWVAAAAGLDVWSDEVEDGLEGKVADGIRDDVL